MPQATNPDVSIIIVNWNSSRYLRACLSSIVDQTHGVRYEVVVVDNNSSESGVVGVCEEFQCVRLVKSEKNVGFARANNLGYYSSRAPYLLFLNPDTIIQGAAIATMLGILTQRIDAGIVGCRLLNTDLTLQTSCVQRYPRVLNQALGADFLYSRLPRLPLWGLKSLFGETDEPSPVEVVSGACLMIRRDLFQEVGLFSGNYFMYADDVDLCHKVAAAGWQCYFVGSAEVVHHGGGSSRLRPVSNWAVVVQCGAKLQFLRQTRGAAYANVYRLSMAVSAVARWLLLSAMTAARVSRKARLAAAATKWAAIFHWSLHPDETLRELTATVEK